MIEQILDSLRKAAESSLQTQQDMFKQLSQQWPSAPTHAAGTTADAKDALQKRLRITVTTALARDRQLVDAAYASGIELIEQTFQLYQARSPEDCKRVLEGLWRKLAERVKEQSESQLRVLQTVSSTWLELEREPKPEVEPSAQ